jgi:rubrerythrin
MPMTNAQWQQFEAHLKSLGKPVTCPICGHDKQHYGDIVMPSVLESGMKVSRMYVGALAQLHCAKCGYTMSFDCQTAKIKVN